MKKTWIVALLVALCPPLVHAAALSEIRKQAEYSMLVPGTVGIDASGKVSAIAIDKADKFPPGLVAYVREEVSSWKFEPVLRDGIPVPARSRMSLLVVARKLSRDSVPIHIRSASFDGEAPKGGEIISELLLSPPYYPESVGAAGVSGTVYVVMKVGRGGEVIEALVEQVNLKAIGKEKVMTAWRKAFAEAALKAARHWTFKPPVHGDQAAASSWTVRVPVDFRLDSDREDRYGKWQVYLPGPANPSIGPVATSKPVPRLIRMPQAASTCWDRTGNPNCLRRWKASDR